MRKFLLFTLFSLMYFGVQAQKGLELKVSGGLVFIGIDPWIDGGVYTGSVLYNVNGAFALGVSYTGGLGTNFKIDHSQNAFETKLNGMALDAYATVVRKGKVKLYLTGGIGQVKVENQVLVPDYTIQDPFGTPVLDLNDSAVGFSLGAGGVLNLGGGAYLNFFEYRFRTLRSDFMDMDKGFRGSVGPMHTLQAGFSFMIGAN